MNPYVILMRLLLASLLGGIIGIERQSKHRPAGFRTHILVCLGAALIMCLSEDMFIRYHDLYGINSDPARMGAQVINGIGFLGAGTIIHFGTSVKGLTTAASVWTVACVGLAAGAGFYFGAIVVTVIIFVTLIILTRISAKLDHTGSNLELMVAFRNQPETLGSLFMFLGEHHINVVDMEYIDEDVSVENPMRNVRIILMLKKNIHFYQVIDDIEKLDGIVKVERI